MSNKVKWVMEFVEVTQSVDVYTVNQKVENQKKAEISKHFHLHFCTSRFSVLP